MTSPMAPNRSLLASLIVAALVVAALSLLAFPARAASGYTARGPILIVGDAGFTSANGVSGGSGTVADPYLIQGWSIDASGRDGIVVRNTTAAFAIRDVLVYSGGYAYNGIVLDNASWALVRNATLTHDASGAVIRGCANVSLVANAVILNAWNGIDVADSRDVFLNGNSVTYNRDGLSVQRSERVRLTGNSASLNTQDGAFLSDLRDAALMGGTFASNGWSGLSLSGGLNVTVFANEISSNDRLGLVVATVDGLQVLSNAFFSNTAGSVQLTGVTNVSVDANDLSPAGGSGIVIESAQRVRVARNSVSQANYSGILLAQVDNVSVESNRLSNNDVGVGTLNVSSLRMESNLIGTSTERGVSLVGTRDITLGNNNVSRNGNGIVLDSSSGGVLRENTLWENGYGVYLFHSTGIVVVNNTFLDNAPQAYDDGAGQNSWDGGYPAGGNYWSDYRGVDLCSGVNQTVCIDPDGIGDTPYPVGRGVWDRYPLMRLRGSSNESPVASFVVIPAAGNTTTLFLFDASSSYDLQDPTAMLLVRWDLDGDGTWDTAWTSNRTVSHRYSQPGDYAVRLEVLDLSGFMTDRVLVVHVAAAPSPPPLVNLTPGLALLVLASALLAVVVYRRVRAMRPPVGQPAWRLRARQRP